MHFHPGMDKPVSTARSSDGPVTHYSHYVCCHPQVAGCLRFRFNRDFLATSYAPGTAPPEVTSPCLTSGHSSFGEQHEVMLVSQEAQMTCPRTHGFAAAKQGFNHGSE